MNQKGARTLKETSGARWEVTMLTTSLRIAAVCIVVASVVATGADAAHRGGGGGGGGHGGFGGGHGGFGGHMGGFGGGRSIGHAAPSFRSMPSFRSAPRMSAPRMSVHRSVAPHIRANTSVGRRSIT